MTAITMDDYEAMAGTRYGYWTIIGPGKPNPGTSRSVECRCRCGRIRFIPLGNLRSGKSTKCRTCSSMELRVSPPVCRDCKSPCARRGGRCWACYLATIIGVPKPARNPLGVRIESIAELNGVTKQAVSLYMKTHGPAATAKYYKMPRRKRR